MYASCVTNTIYCYPLDSADQRIYITYLINNF